MRDSGVTTIFWVPSVLVAIANSGLLSKIRVESLKRILFAGETMPVSKINEWVEAYPGCMFSNLYGPTEITVDCTFFTFYERFEGEHLPIGFPCRNTDILLLNESDNRAKYGEIGELCVRGSSLALGYWNDADKSNSVFVQNPLNPSYRDLIYRTGDLARYDQEGRLIFLGRKVTQIKHMGYRIELGDVDAAISGHEKIASVCTLYLEDSRELVAVIVSKSGEELAAAELKKYCAQKLPKYMIPSRFLRLEELPLTQNGKIDRLKLKSSLVEMRHGRS
jgi:acyl-CoA synthetase (AMP-forming)/AMP-acid ligase II